MICYQSEFILIMDRGPLLQMMIATSLVATVQWAIRVDGGTYLDQHK